MNLPAQLYEAQRQFERAPDTDDDLLPGEVDVMAVLDRADERLHNTCAVMGENRFVCEDLRKARAAAA